LVERSGWAQASVRFCGSFYRGRDVKISVGKDLYSFCNAVVIDGGRAAVTIREPVLLSGWFDVGGAVDGGVVIVDGGGADADGGNRTGAGVTGSEYCNSGETGNPKA
jgi:hypothetical protein